MSMGPDPAELLTVVAVPQPAVGADWSYTLPAPGELIAVHAQLTTSAVSSNRVVRLNIGDGAGHTCVTVPANPAQAGAVGINYSFAAAGSAVSLGNITAEQLPVGLMCGTGWTISTSTQALDVGDQWSNIVLTFRNR